MNLLSRGPIDEHLLTVILPSFLSSLSSKIVDFKAAGYMIGGQLVVTNQISQLLSDEIVSVLVNVSIQSSYMICSTTFNQFLFLIF